MTDPADALGVDSLAPVIPLIKENSVTTAEAEPAIRQKAQASNGVLISFMDVHLRVLLRKRGIKECQSRLRKLSISSLNIQYKECLMLIILCKNAAYGRVGRKSVA